MGKPLMKLGDVVTRKTLIGKRRFIVTGMVHESEHSVTVILAPIPKGMKADDLGRKFVGGRQEVYRWS